MNVFNKTILLLVVAIIHVSVMMGQTTPSCLALKKLQNTSSLYSSKENKRSDTIDILKYTINLDITDFTNQKIKGNTVVKFVPKINGQTTLRLDLLKLTIDSIQHTNSNLTYSYNDTLITINLSSALNIGDTTEVTVFYRGKPKIDGSGWGGFYFSGNYAFNLGVGFDANPHVYGRVWFPCFDNFVEKSIYEFNITTVDTKSAYCNGELINDIVNSGLRTRTWVLSKEISSYLASVSVADYTEVNWNMAAMNGNLPIKLVSRAIDTIKLKNSFTNLKTIITGYENYFGPYQFNRVGYCIVPFSSGAMEHATNITYPLYAIDGTLAEEALMAHELSHHWWGNLVTCETPEDMWINEGMATYSGYLYKNWLHNYEDYLVDIKANHDEMLHYLHLQENGFRAISGVPHEYTYSSHVYQKGADVAHTLRGYMGDTAFFNGLKYVLQQKAFKNMNSLGFRDLLEQSSGQNLHDFFDNWVFSPGWSHFSIDSVITSGTAAPYTSVVYVKQKLLGTSILHSNTPLELTFMNQQWTKEIKPIVMTGASKSFTIQTNVEPKFVGLNVDSKIGDAISSEFKTIKNTGTFSYNLGKAILTVSNSGTDSSFVRVEHNYVAPDAIKNNSNNYRISTNHYWKIDGLLSNGFLSKLKLNYDGNQNFNTSYSYLDHDLSKFNADSLMLVYRKNVADDWHEVKKYTKTKTALRTGYFIVDTLKLGEYAFVNGVSPIVGINEKNKNFTSLQVYPNPASDQLHIEITNYNMQGDEHIEIYTLKGELVVKEKAISQQQTIAIKELAEGTYVLQITRKNKKLASSQFIVQ